MRLSWIPLIVCGAVSAQTRWESTPLGFERVPGNAGLSLPVRWSVGVMQVLLEQSVLPARLNTTPLLRVRFRRAAFASDPADPARTIDCELRLGHLQSTARQMTADMAQNRLVANLVVVAARRTYNVPATPALGAGDAVGADLIDLPLDAPYVFTGPSLLVEWENQAATQNISSGHWVDAVHMEAGVDQGVAVPLGAQGCGSRGGASSMVLLADTTAPPTLGTAFPVLLRNALPLTAGVVMAYLDPLTRGPLGLPFGTDLATFGLRGCYLWAGPDVQLQAASTTLGDVRTSLTLPNIISLRGRPVSMQGFVLDPTANALGVAGSAGLLLRPNFVGVFDRAATVLEHRPNSTTSPWPPFVGLTPVIQLGF